MSTVPQGRLQQALGALVEGREGDGCSPVLAMSVCDDCVSDSEEKFSIPMRLVGRT